MPSSEMPFRHSGDTGCYETSKCLQPSIGLFIHKIKKTAGGEAYFAFLAAFRTAAHRFFCASAILCLASGLSTRFLRVCAPAA
jgi:hypothetical protein